MKGKKIVLKLATTQHYNYIIDCMQRISPITFSICTNQTFDYSSDCPTPKVFFSTFLLSATQHSDYSFVCAV